jgi:hypothetical protein
VLGIPETIFARALCALTFLVASLVSIAPVSADEPLFGYAYTADLLPKGKWELEQWITDREGQAFGHYHNFKFRTEVEYGLTDNFQLSGYINYSYLNAKNNSVAHLTEGLDIPFNHDPTKQYSAMRFDGIAVEGIYRFLSPYKDPIGLAVYLEPEVGPREQALEIRLILQKNFLDDRLVVAANAWIEFEHEQGSNLVTPGSGDVPDGAIEKATMAEIDVGVSYRFLPRWWGGIEFRNHNEFEGFSLAYRNMEHTAFFLGPTIHYGSEHWWITISALRQVGAIGVSSENKAQMRGHRIFGDEHTSWDGIRVRVGYNF